MQKISIITGGAGFIGSHLAEYLVKKNHKVLVIDNFFSGNLKNLQSVIKKIKIVRADISKKGSWEKQFKKANYVFHLAALADIVPSIQNPVKYFDVNVNGTINILENCRKYKVNKIIYAASSSCYGLAKNFPTKESDTIAPEYPYALTKNLGEQVIKHYSKVYNINYNSLRLFNVYGRRSRTSGAYGAMFGVFLAQKLNKLPLTIVGNGKQKRDFTHVKDVARAFVEVAKSKHKNMIFNVGSSKATSINEIAKLMKSEKIFIPKRPAEPEITLADSSLIKRKIGWKPKIDIKEGVNEMLKHIDDWKKAPIWTRKKIKFATKEWFKYLKNEKKN